MCNEIIAQQQEEINKYRAQLTLEQQRTIHQKAPPPAPPPGVAAAPRAQEEQTQIQMLLPTLDAEREAKKNEDLMEAIDKMQRDLTKLIAKEGQGKHKKRTEQDHDIQYNFTKKYDRKMDGIVKLKLRI